MNKVAKKMKTRRVRTPITIITIALALVAVAASAQELHERLNGTWHNDIMTVTFDFENRIYSGVVLGQEFSRKLTLVSEKANIVTFRSDDTKIICQFQEDGRIMLTKDGGIPVLLRKIE